MKSIEPIGRLPASVGGGEFCLILFREKKREKEKRNEKKEIQFQPPTKKLTNYNSPEPSVAGVCVCVQSHTGKR